jgi:thiamine kinase-like enzyme
MFNYGVIHGDIHLKNFMFCEKKQKLLLVDWEPSLIQIIGSQKQLMGTLPYIDDDDQKNQIISIKTDLLCFYRIFRNKRIPFFRKKEWKELCGCAIQSNKPFSYIVNVS